MSYRLLVLALLSWPLAAQTMESAGAPFEVVCRVLMPFKSGKAAPHSSVQHWNDVATR